MDNKERQQLIDNTWRICQTAIAGWRTFDLKGVEMTPSDRKRLSMRANIIKSLSHPSRLLMVEALSAKELCVCELAELVGADMSTVSKHLSILRNAGIVEDEKRGSMVFYRLRTRCVFQFFDCVEAISRESTSAKA